MKKLAIKLALLPFAVPLMLLGASTYAFAGEDVEVSVSLDYVSEYVFRGTTLAGDAIQPGIEVAFGNFTTGAWYSTPVDDPTNAYADELDLYASYSFDVSDAVSADLGILLYHYPQSGGLFDIGTGVGDASTVEIYGSLGFAGPLEPSISVYYDLTLKALTLEGGAGYSFPLAEKTSLDLGATAGIVSLEGPGDYQYGSASASLNYAVSEAVSTYVGVNAAVSSEDTFQRLSNFTPKSSSLWFGAGISAGF